MTHHAAFIGTCTRGMTIPSCLFSEMHLGKFPDQPKFQSWIVDFRAEICEKGEESSARALSRDKERSNILTPSGRLEKVFSGRQLGLVPEGTIVDFSTRMP